MAFKVPNQYRLKIGALKSSNNEGNNGAFVIPHPDNGLGHPCHFYVIASDGDDWEHVSVSLRVNGELRLPIWGEMCFIKDHFWDDEDCVIQYHPPKSKNISNFEVLHLWRPIGIEIIMPPTELV